jgi:UDP-N-acetylglucosamine transferase subunit ALG13
MTVLFFFQIVIFLQHSQVVSLYIIIIHCTNGSGLKSQTLNMPFVICEAALEKGSSGVGIY